MKLIKTQLIGDRTYRFYDGYDIDTANSLELAENEYVYCVINDINIEYTRAAQDAFSQITTPNVNGFVINGNTKVSDGVDFIIRELERVSEKVEFQPWQTRKSKNSKEYRQKRK